METIAFNPNAPSASPKEDAVAEANHRFANSLALLVSLVRMQAASIARANQPLPPAEARLLIEGIAARINTIGQLYRFIAHVPHEGVVELKPHLHDVTSALVAALSSPHQPMRVEHHGQDCLVLTRHVQPLTLILCEIFINAMKYAHPAGVPIVMTVACHAGPDGTLVLEMRDDGVGLPDNFDMKTNGGLGFRVIRSLANELGARMEVDNQGLGLGFRLMLPAVSAANAELA